MNKYPYRNAKSAQRETSQRVESACKDYAIKESRALKATIIYMIENGYMDDDFNPLKYDKGQTTLMFDAILKKENNNNHFEEPKSAMVKFEGLNILKGLPK